MRSAYCYNHHNQTFIAVVKNMFRFKAGSRFRNGILTIAIESMPPVKYTTSGRKRRTRARVYLRFGLTAGLVITLALTAFTANTQAAAPNQSPLPFETAIRSTFNKLIDDVRKDLGNTSGPEEMVIVLDLFSDEDTGEIPRVSQRIQSVMLDEATRRFFEFRVARFTLEESRNADYMIRGSIHLGATETKDIIIYRVSAEVIDAWNMNTIGTARKWVSDPELDYNPLALYHDNPFYDPAYFQRKKVKGEVGNIGSTAHPIYSMETLALLRDATSAYERRNYQNALALFSDAAARADGQTLLILTELYLTNFRLGRLTEADSTFTRIIDIGVKRYGKITVRFLFRKNSVDFWEGDVATARYGAWLGRIGEYFYQREDCLRIVGHSSNSGPEPWNEQLSVLRAEQIQYLLRGSLPGVKKRTLATGVGSRENVVGIGTDDERDALDRRVELIPVVCKELE